MSSIVDVDEFQDIYGDDIKVQVIQGRVHLSAYIRSGDATCMIFTEDQVNQLIIALDRAKEVLDV